MTAAKDGNAARADDGKVLAANRRARHDYNIGEVCEAGLQLQGWEVKAVRRGRAQLRESFVAAARGELRLINCHITPLTAASSHVKPEPSRSRKLLMHRREISRLIGKAKAGGLTLVPLDLHLRRGKIKLQLAVAQGKKGPDKRHTLREREWKRQQERLLKTRAAHGGGKKS